MNILQIVLLLGVAASYLFFWRVFISLRNRKHEAERQVLEKTEMLAYASTSERKSSEQLVLVNASKKHLSYLINHEIRTPLNGILGMVSLLDETPLTQEQKDYNGTIRHCSETLITMINDVFLGDALANSKVDGDQNQPEHKKFDLRNSIEEVFEVFASQTAKTNLELVYHVDHRVPSLVVGDSLRLRQVLMNLVENALTFTRDGEIFVKVDVADENANILDLEFEVHDNGLGMPNDLVKLVSMDHLSIDKSKQSDNSLLISKRIISQMGGRLKIESIKGKGTMAKFNLQIQKSEPILPVVLDVTTHYGKRILVVEDNATLRKALVSEIKRSNLEPSVASSGAEALEMLAEDSTFDLALIEMQMPEMDGLMLSQAIRTKNPSLPIILMSVASDSESKNHPELFRSVIMKPIRFHILNEHILRSLVHTEEPNPTAINSSSPKLSSEFAIKYPLRILVAEDNRMNQKLAMKVLAKLGYDPDIVQTGKEVLEEVSRLKYDLILMDVQMPEMDGLEATRMLRLCLTSQPIIIAMTANAMHGDREECLQAGMDDYISKPVHVEDLVIMLEKWALHVNGKVNAL
ncbi:MAG TPA: response regulator [Chryseolinea sp.]|nr:response regulator [Chryseolinea sp.]